MGLLKTSKTIFGQNKFFIFLLRYKVNFILGPLFAKIEIF
jgi:hypothetical protein